MKSLYKEILKREGGKVNLTAAQVSEVVAVLADILTDEDKLKQLHEFEDYLAKKKKNKYPRKMKFSFCFIGFRGEY